jgi:hypothetical protein
VLTDGQGVAALTDRQGDAVLTDRQGDAVLTDRQGDAVLTDGRATPCSNSPRSFAAAELRAASPCPSLITSEH